MGQPLMPYSERVHSPRWLALATLGAAVALCGWGLWLLVVTGEIVPGLILSAVGATLAVVARAFLVVRIAVDDDSLRVRLGPFGFTLAGHSIEAARVSRYRWISYGGWGLRWGRDGGRSARACSVPFLRSGVAVDATDGRRYYVSSASPDDLAAAIDRLADRARPA